MQVVFDSLSQDLTAKQIVAGTSRDLKPGTCTYLTESSEVISVLGDVVQVMFVDSELIAFVIGMNTSNMQIGNRYTFNLVETKGHQGYETFFGAGSSGIVIDAVSESEWKQAVAAARELNAQSLRMNREQEIRELQEKIDSVGPETWTAGKFSTTATFVSATSDSVTLRKESGEEITVPIDRLDDDSKKTALKRAGELTRWNRRIRQLERLMGND